MSLLGKSVMRLVPVVLESLPKASQISSSLVGSRVLARDFNCLSTTSAFKIHQKNLLKTPCSCGCNGRHLQTQGGKELAAFLKEEIAEEKKSLAKATPAKLDDFQVKADRAQVTLTKQFQGETITVSIDVNHTVDAEAPLQQLPDGQEAEFKSRPSFEVDVKVGSQVLSFTCSFMSPEETESQEQDTVTDVFGINEVTIYDGEWSEEVYCVSGDILDANLYDLLMNYLEERGVSDEFVERISDLCSEYEHSLYVGLLEKLKDFVSK